MSKQKFEYDHDKLDSTGENEVNPYFGIISGNQRSSGELRREPETQSQSREEPKQSSNYSSATRYQAILGRDDGSYCWYRLEQRTDDADLKPEAGETFTKSSKPSEKERAGFLEQSSAWMQKYVSGVKKQGDSSSSTNSTWLPEEMKSVKPEPSGNISAGTTSTEAVEKVENTSLNPLDDDPGEKPPEHQTCRQGVAKSEPLRLKHVQQNIVEESSQVSEGATDRKAVIEETLKTFQILWEHYESESDVPGQPKRRRSDMRAYAYMREMKWSLEEDIVGEVKGVEVGDNFSWRAEMSVIGLHKEFVAGINVFKRPEIEGGPIATSVVFGVSSSYSDNIYRVGESDPSIYSGEGGLPSSRGSSTTESGGYKDQTLTGRNLALKQSAKQKIPIRVIKGVPRCNKDDKRYVYDGLYEIAEWKFEPGVHGNKVYKFMLSRLVKKNP